MRYSRLEDGLIWTRSGSATLVSLLAEKGADHASSEHDYKKGRLPVRISHQD
jgi:hypothetical protein